MYEVHVMMHTPDVVEGGETLAGIWTQMIETGKPTIMVVSSGIIQGDDKARESQHCGGI